MVESVVADMVYNTKWIYNRFGHSSKIRIKVEGSSIAEGHMPYLWIVIY